MAVDNLTEYFQKEMQLDLEKKSREIAGLIMGDLQNRSGFNGILNGIDEVGKTSLMNAWTNIIHNAINPPDEMDDPEEVLQGGSE